MPLVPQVASPLTVGASRSGGGATPGSIPDGAGGLLIPEVANPLTARMAKGVNTTADEGQTMIAHAFKMRGGGNSTGERGGNTGASGGTGYLGQDECAFTVSTSEDQMVAVPQAFDITGIPATQGAHPADVHVPLRARRPGESEGSTTTVVQHGWAVRRLTPRECERLQSFPDDYTLIPWRGKPADQCPDGPRYKALGNSWCVNEVKKLAHKINIVRQIKAGMP